MQKSQLVSCIPSSQCTPARPFLSLYKPHPTPFNLSVMGLGNTGFQFGGALFRAVTGSNSYMALTGHICLRSSVVDSDSSLF